MEVDRRKARELAAQAIARGDPLDWFEELYAEAERGRAEVPWADKRVNAHLASWPLLDKTSMRRAIVVGCGFGDDAEWLAQQGLSVTAFDISPTAIETCRRRFPKSRVHYRQADLLKLPREWVEDPFDLVVDAYTVQVLPPGSAERAAAFAALASLTGCALVIIARGRAEGEDPGSMPWPVTADELGSVVSSGLEEAAFDDYLDDETPPVRRFRATYLRM